MLMNKQENRQYMNARVQAVVFCKLPSSIKAHKAAVDPAHPIASKLQWAHSLSAYTLHAHKSPSYHQPYASPLRPRPVP